MIQGQCQPPGKRDWRSIQSFQRGHIRHRHPVLFPVALLLGALVLLLASSFANTLFPLLVLLGVPSTQLCLAIALVLGIVGSLTGIIGIIERLDHRSTHTGLAMPKEHGHADRN
jgi:hypothetical protein